MAGPINLPKPSFAKFSIEYAPGEGYFVLDPEGRRVSSCIRSRDMAVHGCAAKQAAHNAAKKIRPRPCLCCGHEFLSEGIHNRMCNPCRNRASNDEATPFSFGAIHGRKRA